MRIAVTRELTPGERRVALVPESVKRLIAAGAQVAVEEGAGAAAFFTDATYQEAGAELVQGHRELISSADLWLKVRPPLESPTDQAEIGSLRRDSVLVGVLQPLSSPDLMTAIAASGVTAFSLDQLPRISRAQDMDVLSSMSTAAGYEAVVIAASRLPRFFPLLMTAAGTVTPARVLVLGAGVAGLQAIATARRLGAVVRAFDVRPAVKEQIESLGAQFVNVEVEGGEGSGGYAAESSEAAQKREQEALAREVGEADVVISTALIPGRPAPVLITREAAQGMRPGSVILDLAAEAGGNCELTRAGEEVEHGGVLILGPLDLPSRMPFHTSQLYSRNVTRFCLSLVKEGALQLDFEDEVVQATCITREGKVVHQATLARQTGSQ